MSYKPDLLPVGSIIAWSGGYFTASNNGGSYTDVLGNTIANANAYLTPRGYKICDGTSVNDSKSPIFNGVNRFLPNLTDSRFLHGSTTAGSIGGQNSVTLQATNLPSFSFGTNETSNYSAVNVAADGHGHGYNLYTRSVHSASNYIRNAFVATDTFTATRGANITVSGISTAESFGVPIAGSIFGNSSATTVATTANLLNHSHSVSVGPGNGGLNSTAFENRPLYFNVFYIIKIK
jgi:hypothetical protein